MPSRKLKVIVTATKLFSFSPFRDTCFHRSEIDAAPKSRLFPERAGDAALGKDIFPVFFSLLTLLRCVFVCRRVRKGETLSNPANEPCAVCHAARLTNDTQLAR